MSLTGGGRRRGFKLAARSAGVPIRSESAAGGHRRWLLVAPYGAEAVGRLVDKPPVHMDVVTQRDCGSQS
jgi:hypothetical protein